MFIFHSPPPSSARKASCVLSCCWHGYSPLHLMWAWRTWPISWHGMVQCVYEAFLECPVICLSLSHCSYEEHWHSLPAPGSLDPLSLGHLRGYGGSGIFATGGAETGRGWFCGWLATCFSMAIRCCWSLKLSIWLLITGWLWQSLVPTSRLLKERSISSSSGDVDRDVLAELLVSGLEAFEDGCELLSDDVSDELLSVPLVLVLSVLELPDGELGKDSEDSLVVVSDTGCELAGWESLDDGCGSLRSECLLFTAVCLIGMSRSGSVMFSLKSLLFLVEVSRPGCLLGGIDTVLVTGLSPNLVILARLLGWTLLSGTVSETKTWDVLVCLILPLQFAEMTIFWPFATRWRPELTEFSLSDGAFPSLAAEGTALRCKKRIVNVWYVRPSWSDVWAVPRELFPRGFYLSLIAPATVSDTCNESVNPFVTRP